MKKRVMLFMAMVLVIGVSGCAMKRESKVDRMLLYINEKYPDDKFEFVSITGGHVGSKDSKIVVASEKFPNKEIRVIYSENNGKESFTDTYLNVKFEEQTYTFIKNALSEAFQTEVYVKYVPDDTGNMKSGTQDTTFEEYIADATTYIYFTAVVGADITDKENAEQRIKTAFSNAVICANIYFVEESESAATLNEALLCIEENRYSHSLFVVKETVEQYQRFEWR